MSPSSTVKKTSPYLEKNEPNASIHRKALIALAVVLIVGVLSGLGTISSMRHMIPSATSAPEDATETTFGSLYTTTDSGLVIDGRTRLDPRGRLEVPLPFELDSADDANPQVSVVPIGQAMPQLDAHVNRVDRGGATQLILTIGGGAPHGDISWSVSLPGKQL